MNELHCSNGECGEVILGWGVMVWDATRSVNWQEHGVRDVIITTLPTGEETQALTFHTNCFYQVLDELQKQESSAALTMILGGVGDFLAAINDPLGLEDEEVEE